MTIGNKRLCLALALTVVGALVSGLLTPEVRRWLGLDHSAPANASDNSKKDDTRPVTPPPGPKSSHVAQDPRPSPTNTISHLTTTDDSPPNLEDCEGLDQAAKQKPALPAKAEVISAGQINTEASQQFIIRGNHFGVAEPFNGCSPFIRLVDLTNGNVFGHFNVGVCTPIVVTSWTDSEIVVEGFPSFRPGQEVFHIGDAIKIEVGNPQTQGWEGPINGFDGAPVGSNVTRVTGQPTTDTEPHPFLSQARATDRVEAPGGAQVVCSGSIHTQASQRFTIRGNHFGVGEAFNGCSPFIRLVDLTNGSVFGHFNVGVCIPIVVTSWNDSEIVVEGFPSFRRGQDIFRVGDAIRIEVGNPQTQGVVGPGNGFMGAPIGWYVKRVTAQGSARRPE